MDITQDVAGGDAVVALLMLWRADVERDPVTDLGITTDIAMAVIGGAR